MVGWLASIKAALVVERGCVGEVKIREGRERRGMGIVQRDLMGMVVRCVWRSWREREGCRRSGEVGCGWSEGSLVACLLTVGSSCPTC